MAEKFDTELYDEFLELAVTQVVKMKMHRQTSLHSNHWNHEFYLWAVVLQIQCTWQKAVQELTVLRFRRSDQEEHERHLRRP